MANFNENLTVNGQNRGQRAVGGLGIIAPIARPAEWRRFVIHDPWGNASIPQGAVDGLLEPGTVMVSPTTAGLRLSEQAYDAWVAGWSPGPDAIGSTGA
jgi:hypothetical protein